MGFELVCRETIRKRVEVCGMTLRRRSSVCTTTLPARYVPMCRMDLVWCAKYLVVLLRLAL